MENYLELTSIKYDEYDGYLYLGLDNGSTLRLAISEAAEVGGGAMEAVRMKSLKGINTPEELEIALMELEDARALRMSYSEVR